MQDLNIQKNSIGNKLQCTNFWGSSREVDYSGEGFKGKAAATAFVFARVQVGKILLMQNLYIQANNIGKKLQYLSFGKILKDASPTKINADEDEETSAGTKPNSAKESQAGLELHQIWVKATFLRGHKIH